MTKTGKASLPGVIASLPFLIPPAFTLHGSASRICRRAVMRTGRSGLCEVARNRPKASVFPRSAQYRGH
jgi:hypothetical protein